MGDTDACSTAQHAGIIPPCCRCGSLLLPLSQRTHLRVQFDLLCGEEAYVGLRHCHACRWTFKPEWIPLVVFSADVITGLASGMTIKFFPIFFMKKVIFSISEAPFILTPNEPLRRLLFRCE